MKFDQEPEQAVEVTLRGSPIQADKPGEKSIWSRFLAALVEVLKPISGAAGSILQIEFQNRAATVQKKQSEVALNIAQRKKIETETAEIVARIDRENAKQTKPLLKAEEISVEQLRDELDEWLAKAEILRLKSGTEFKLLSNKPANLGKSV